MKCSFCDNKANAYENYAWCPLCNLTYAYRCTKCNQIMEDNIRESPLWKVVEKLTEDHNNDEHKSVELV